jgi:hypothetical protein
MDACVMRVVCYKDTPLASCLGTGLTYDIGIKQKQIQAIGDLILGSSILFEVGHWYEKSS